MIAECNYDYYSCKLYWENWAIDIYGSHLAFYPQSFYNPWEETFFSYVMNIIDHGHNVSVDNFFDLFRIMNCKNYCRKTTFLCNCFYACLLKICRDFYVHKTSYMMVKSLTYFLMNNFLNFCWKIDFVFYYFDSQCRALSDYKGFLNQTVLRLIFFSFSMCVTLMTYLKKKILMNCFFLGFFNLSL